jgi:FAT domain-containing protein
MVRAQMLSELEEIIAYKQFADQPERQQTIRKTWVKRFAHFICTSSYAQSSPDSKGVSLM